MDGYRFVLDLPSKLSIRYIADIISKSTVTITFIWKFTFIITAQSDKQTTLKATTQQREKMNN